MMFKILILQARYNLSDEALEEQIARDLMFRRFIGLSLSDAVPDHSTIWRFRNLLHTENLLDSFIGADQSSSRDLSITIQNKVFFGILRYAKIIRNTSQTIRLDR